MHNKVKAIVLSHHYAFRCRSRKATNAFTLRWQLLIRLFFLKESKRGIIICEKDCIQMEKWHNFQWLCCIMSVCARLLSLAPVMVMSLQHSMSPVKGKAVRKTLKARQTNNSTDPYTHWTTCHALMQKLQIKKDKEEQIGKIK